MSYRCQKCQKGNSTGNNVSHSNRKTKRLFKANLLQKRVFNPETGDTERMKICTKCLKTMAKDNV